MFNNQSIDWTQLVQLTNSGLIVADYVTIRKAVTARFKEIYGEDIDLSTGTADGDYIEMYSLIINNILQSLKSLYANLNVNTATGKYLDILSALTNVHRLPATNSTCSLVVTLDSGTEYRTSSISFADENGNVWTANARDFQLPNNEFVFQNGIETVIVVTCETAGAIKAPAGTEANNWTDGWIDRLVNQEVLMTIQQKQDAIPGKAEESDASLRKRRNSSTGTKSNSVLDGLIGAIFNIGGIDDVKVYNNVSDEAVNAKNNSQIAAHSIYVLIRRNQNVEIADSIIGTVIYESMTPGILTVNGNVQTYAIPKSFTYEQYFLDTVAYLNVPQNVFWGEVKTVQERASYSSFHLKIEIEPRQNFASANNSTAILIANAVMQYANGLRIGEDLICRDVYDTAEMADPLFRGRATFDIVSVSVGDTVKQLKDTLITSYDEVFNFTSYSIDTSNPSSIIIEIW